MTSRDREFLKRLIDTFRTEAEEHIASISAGLIEIETAEGHARSTAIETIFRETHSLKGAARSVNLPRIEALCQSMENVLAAAKRNELALLSDSIDILLVAVERLRNMLDAVVEEQPQTSTTEDADLIRELDAMLAAGAPSNPDMDLPGGAPSIEKEAATTDSRSTEPVLNQESVRVPLARLERILQEAETLRIGRSGIVALVDSIQTAVAECELWRRSWNGTYSTIRALEKDLDDVHGLHQRPVGADGRTSLGADSSSQVRRVFDFFEWNETFMVSMEDRLRSLLKSAIQSELPITSTSDKLLNETIEALMLPVSYLTDALPAFVRRVSRDQSKEVDLKLGGTDIELDSRLLQEVKEPIVHLLRNCIDHGLEKPAERETLGKPRRGVISLLVEPIDSGKIEIRVSDDGRGIDVDRVRESALRLGLVTSDNASRMEDQQALDFIFRSGFSTSPIVTDLSGRGLGLAIVREKVEGIGGTLSVETSAGQGTTFHLELLTTMSSFRGVIVRSGGSLFVIPTMSVERVAAFSLQGVKTIENFPTVVLDGETVPLVVLSSILRMSTAPGEYATSEMLTCALLRFAGDRIAFLVDEVIDEQEVLEKNLGAYLQGLQGIAGVAVTAAGRIMPVLNVADLFRTARVNGASIEFQLKNATTSQPAALSVLVVEDSITARSLMKNILEGAGFRVEVAVDGVDGFTKLKQGAFDLVVSDVEMPRMDGFDLTMKIRSDKKLGDLPVVLVTALESARDKERGIEAGANAYVVKSTFEDSNLVEIVQQLV